MSKYWLPFISSIVRHAPLLTLKGRSVRASHWSVSLWYFRRPVGLADPPNRMRMVSDWAAKQALIISPDLEVPLIENDWSQLRLNHNWERICNRLDRLTPMWRKGGSLWRSTRQSRTPPRNRWDFPRPRGPLPRTSSGRRSSRPFLPSLLTWALRFARASFAFYVGRKKIRYGKKSKDRLCDPAL